MKKYLLFLLFFASMAVQAQTLIKGQVNDEKTKKPLQGVNVYVNNSTLGTATDQDGKFAFSVPFNGKIELVFSYIGYNKNTIILESQDVNELAVELKQQSNTLNEVVIKATKSKSGNFDKWGPLFSKLLLGNSHSFVAGCTIKNPEVLVFYFDQLTNQLAVYAKSPLIIENRLTAYRIKLDFDNFKYDFNTYVLECSYSAFFEEMSRPKDKEATVIMWRHMAYYGSQMHFMRALHANDLTRNGYVVYVYKAIQNKEKERVSKIIQQKLTENSVTQSSVVYDIGKLFKIRDTANYYKMIMKQEDVLSADTVRTNIKRYSSLNRQLDIISFKSKDSLMINYQMFLDRNNKLVTPENLEKWKMKDFKAKNKGLVTIFYFVGDEGINVQRTGYYPETGLYMYNDMFDRRISQLLPWDYDPDKGG